MTSPHHKATVNLLSNAHEFMEQLGNLNVYSLTLAQVMGSWAGGNRSMFTRLLAAKTIGVVKTTIDTQGSGEGSANVRWDVLDTRYQAWKNEKYGASGPEFWKMTNKVRSNIVARRSSEGFVVGLDRRVRVPRIQYGRVGGNVGRGASIGLEEYASAIEYGAGGRMPKPRPLFAPSIAKVLQEDFPEMTRMVHESFVDAVKILMPKGPSFGAAVSADPKDVIGQATLEMSEGLTKFHINDILTGMKTNGGFQIDSKYKKNNDSVDKFIRRQEAKGKKYLAHIRNPVDRERLFKWALGREEEFNG